MEIRICTFKISIYCNIFNVQRKLNMYIDVISHVYSKIRELWVGLKISEEMRSMRLEYWNEVLCPEINKYIDMQIPVGGWLICKWHNDHELSSAF